MKQLIFLPFLWLTSTVLAQSKIQVIKATSSKVSINDDGVWDKNWRLSPKTRPDIFTADRNRKSKWVTFYTDIDSIRVKLKPGMKFNFVILLNGKDSCFTQIASAMPPRDKSRSGTAVSDTIPFTLTAYNAIAFKAVLNDTDTVNLHFDTGSWGLHLTRDAMAAKNIQQVSKLQIGKLVFDHPEFAATSQTAHGIDGRFGWTLFDGKQVELDFDKNLLIVHSGKLSRSFRGYQRFNLAFKHDFLVLKGSLKQGSRIYPGNFMMDSGSEQAMILDSAWAAPADFAAGLKVLKSVTLHNPKGIAFETRLVLAPEFQVSNFQLSNVPSLIFGGPNPAGFPVNILVGDVLKRFNMILDFSSDKVYLNKNRLAGTIYRGQD